MDVSTKENLSKLVQIGKDLLKKPGSRVNLETGLYEPAGTAATNEESLTHFAQLLSEERQRRRGKMATSTE